MTWVLSVMVVTLNGRGMLCWVTGCQNQLRLGHCCTCSAFARLFLCCFRWFLLWFFLKYTTHIMGYFPPRLDLLEVPIWFPHPPALPTKCTGSLSKSNTMNRFAFSQGRSKPCCLSQPVPHMHYRDLTSYNMQGFCLGRAMSVTWSSGIN